MEQKWYTSYLSPTGWIRIELFRIGIFLVSTTVQRSEWIEALNEGRKGVKS